MGRFNDILKGKRARQTVSFPALLDHGSFLVPRGDQGGQAGTKTEADAAPVPERAPSVAPDPPVLVDLIVLTGDETTRVLAQARADAIGNGVSDPKDGEPLYDLAVMVHTLLLSVVDHDSAPGEERPFFDSAEQIRKHLDGQRIGYLYALQEVWQDECAPQRIDLSEQEMLEWVLELAESEDPQVPFGRLRPASRWIYMRSLARLLVSSRDFRSLHGLPLGSDLGSGTTRSTEIQTGTA
jgi:hypothetical protein